MPPKPPLKLVATARNPPDAPDDLGAAGLELWRSITFEFDVSDAEGLLMLRQAALACDRAARCREIIDTDGELIRGRDGPKAHPLLQAELQNRALVTRTIARLGLRLEPVKAVGRPGGSRAS